MTAPTHAAFGILWAALVSAGNPATFAAALGALLPDIDHPQSSIGRLFWFISHPINNRLGHRALVHSFVLWTPLLIVGIALDSTIIKWLALGAYSHILIDSYNVSGVKAFLPFTDRQVVCFKRDWRLITGSTHEIVAFIIIVSMIFIMNHTYTIGGPRKLINMLARSPKIMGEEYQRAGLKVCHVKGKFRWADGRIDHVKWLVIGSEGLDLVFWDNERIIRKRHGAFMRATLVQSDKDWPVVQVQGFCTTDQDSFWFDGKRWMHAKAGLSIFGTLKSVDVSIPIIKTADDPLAKFLKEPQ